MDNRRNRNVLVIAVITVVFVFLLASALRKSELLPGGGLPFWLDWNFDPIPPLSVPGGEFMLALTRFIYTAAFILLPFSLIYLFLSKDARKYFLRFMVRLLPVCLLIYWVIRFFINLKTEVPETEMIYGMAPTPEIITRSQIPEFVPNVSERLVTILSIAVSFLVVLVLFGLGWWFWRRARQRRNALGQIADEAQSALDNIQTGGDLRSVIIRCYMEMSRVVADARGLQRGRTVTPHEFVTYLTGDGLPQQPVEQLTDLFEAVRYGSDHPTPLQERIAVDCLQSIVDFCRSAK